MEICENVCKFMIINRVQLVECGKVNYFPLFPSNDKTCSQNQVSAGGSVEASMANSLWSYRPYLKGGKKIKYPII